MNHRIRQSLVLLLLAIYIPITTLIGVLHTDELVGGNDGRLTFKSTSAHIQTGKLDNGSCLACVFAAGHAPLPDTYLPSTASEQFVPESSASFVPKVAHRTPTARAPPRLAYT